MKKTLKQSYYKYLIPTLLAMVMFSTYTMVDGIFVGQGVGALGLAAVNVSMPFVTLSFSLAILISIGSLNLITYQLGRGDKQRADEYFTLCLFLSLIVAISISILGFIFLDPIINLLGATDQIRSLVYDYLHIIMIFTPFYVMAYVFEIMVKADGIPQLSTILMVFSAFINIFLDYIFIFKYLMGVKGAAIATGLAQVFATVGYLVYFLSKRAKLKIVRFKIKTFMVKETVIFGIPAFLAELSTGFIILIFNNVLERTYGVDGLTAFSVISYIMTFVVNMMLAINQASQPLISYNYGRRSKKNLETMKRYVRITVGIISSILFILIMLMPEFFIRVFISNPSMDLLEFSKKSLRIFSTSFLILGFNITNAGFMSSVKLPRYDFYISTLRGYVIVSILLIILPRLLGKEIIWYVLSISELITLFLSIYLIGKMKKSLDKLNKKDFNEKYS